MSTILWVEDFGVKSDSATKLVLIKELLGNDVEYPEDILDHKATREFLKKHNILLAVTVDEALTQIQKSDAFDFVVLDVDVPKSTLSSCENSKTIEKLETREIEWLKANDSEYLEANKDSKDTKLKKSLKNNAGFHLAMYLVLDKGFPRSHIVFFSAHGDWYYPNDNQSALQRKLVLQRHFIGARMGENPFHFFLKSDANKSGTLPKVQSSGSNSETNNKEEIFEWIDTRRQREKGYDYFILRRGIIDACENLGAMIDACEESGKTDGLLNVKLKVIVNNKRQNHENAEEALARRKKENYDEFCGEIKDKLAELRAMLPMVEPEDENKKHLLKRMARAITHDWEAYKPSKEMKFSYLLKAARNWLTHDSHHNMNVDEEMVAFLFILHMRSVFNLNDKELMTYEEKLLSVFKAVDKVGEEGLKLGIKESYEKIWNDNLHSNIYFLRLADAQHKLDEGGKPSSKHCYNRLLFQSFFHIYFKPSMSIADPTKRYNNDNSKVTPSLLAYINFTRKKPKFNNRPQYNDYCSSLPRNYEGMLCKFFYNKAFSAPNE